MQLMLAEHISAGALYAVGWLVITQQRGGGASFIAESTQF